mmetsp:Transcript_34298/g.58730  ORF Transcript_34298/g.58730 Transcript_34298/m.58730 type:complete len:467 (+) Transcript_34298:30-1430(+)
MEGDISPAPVESLDIPPELLQFLVNDPSYVICPKCNNVWENAGAGNEADCKHLKTDNGKALTQECITHYTHHRFRCQRCESIFCSSCKRIPYHLGFTCEGFENAKDAFRCRWCKENVDSSFIASSGPPKDPQRLVCDACKEKDSACMNRTHPECGHPAIWHHSMPTRKLADCIQVDCVKKRISELGEDNTSQINVEDFCNICWTEELGEHPCLKLKCGHIFHAHCIKNKLAIRWEAGGPVNLSFMDCPLCKAPIQWPAICQPQVNNLRELLEMRQDLQYRCLQQIKNLGDEIPEEIRNASEEEQFNYARGKLNFYECYKCKSFYYGGKRECDAAAAGRNDDNEEGEREQEPILDPTALVCGGCRGTCSTHGSEHMVFKCRFCCSVASYFCFGHTHFCPSCHTKPWNIVSQNNYQFIVGKLPLCPGKDECPLGIEHPPNGEEYVLGCACCEDFKVPTMVTDDPKPSN